MQLGSRLETLYYRSREAGVWSSWHRVHHSGNMNLSTVNFTASTLKATTYTGNTSGRVYLETGNSGATGNFTEVKLGGWSGDFFVVKKGSSTDINLLKVSEASGIEVESTIQDVLNIHRTGNVGPVGIRFSDAMGVAQTGYLRANHRDADSMGAGYSFRIGSSEGSTNVILDGTGNFIAGTNQVWHAGNLTQANVDKIHTQNTDSGTNITSFTIANTTAWVNGVAGGLWVGNAGNSNPYLRVLQLSTGLREYQFYNNWDNRTYADIRAKDIYANNRRLGSEDYVQSRAQNLVTNGTGHMGDNTNFSGFAFEGKHAYAGKGGFTSTAYGSKTSDEFLPVNTEGTYRLTSMAKQVEGTSQSFYQGLIPYDVDGLQICPWNVPTNRAVLELAQPLKNGDTVIYLNGTDGLYDDQAGTHHTHGFIIWNYKNSFGYDYGVNTYSRHAWYGLWSNGAINRTNNTVTLPAPWNYSNPDAADGIWPVGTKCGGTASGGTFIYLNNTSSLSTTWTRYTNTIGKNGTYKFWEGTAFVKLLWLTNYGNLLPAKQVVSNIEFGLDIEDVVSASLGGAFKKTVNFEAGLTTTTFATTSTALVTNLNAHYVEGVRGTHMMQKYADNDISHKIYVNSTLNRQAGMYGIYDSTKAGHIWSMGTAYAIAADGSTLGNLYGAAYAYQSHATVGNKAGGHQFLWAQNGTVSAAMGDNFWTGGDYITRDNTNFGLRNEANTSWVRVHSSLGNMNLKVSDAAKGIYHDAKAHYFRDNSGGISNNTALTVYGTLTTTGTLTASLLTASTLKLGSGSGFNDSDQSTAFLQNGGTSNTFYVLRTATLGAGGVSFAISNAGNVGVGMNPSGTYKLEVSGSVGAGNITATGTLAVSGTSTFTGNVNITDQRHLNVRHLNGIAMTGTAADTLYLNYSNGKAVSIGSATASSYLDVFGGLNIRETAAIKGTAQFESLVTLKGNLRGSFDNNRFTTWGKATLDLHPESDDHVVLPFLSNDLAYLRYKGGSITTTLPAATWQLDAMVDGSPSYASFDTNVIPTSVTIELTFHKSFYWGNRSGISFGNAIYRAKSIKLEMFRSDTNVWETVQDVTNWADPTFSCNTPANSWAYTKMRWTLSDYASPAHTSGLRIAQIWLINYASTLSKEVFVGRDGGNLYRGIAIKSDSYNDHINVVRNNKWVALTVGTNGEAYLNGNGILHKDAGGVDRVVYHSGNLNSSAFNFDAKTIFADTVIAGTERSAVIAAATAPLQSRNVKAGDWANNVSMVHSGKRTWGIQIHDDGRFAITDHDLAIQRLSINTAGQTTLAFSNGGSMRFEGSSTSGSALVFSNTNSTSVIRNVGGSNEILEFATKGYHVFLTDGVDRGRINHLGNWLIGTATDSGYKLDVSGTARFTGTITSNNGVPLISMGGSYKSWVFHKPATDSFLFAPSTTANGTTWDWANQIEFQSNGKMFIASKEVYHAGNFNPKEYTKVYNFNKSVPKNQLQKLARFKIPAEGTIQFMITVQSRTSSNSGTNTYLFQGGYASTDGTWRPLRPLAQGRGHGDSTEGFDLLVRRAQNDDGTGVDYYAYQFAVAAKGATINKTLFVTFHDLNGDRDVIYTDESAGAPVATPTLGTPLYSHRLLEAEDIKINANTVWHAGNLNHATADFTAQTLTVTGQAHVASNININNGSSLNARHINGRTAAASGVTDHLYLQYSNGFNVYIGAAANSSNLTTYGTITSSAAQPTLLNLTRTNNTVNVGVQYSSTSTTIFAGMGSAGEFAIGTTADLTGGAFKVVAASGNVSTTGTITATGGNSTNWNTAYGWGDYRQFGLGITTDTAQSDLNAVTYSGLYSITTTTLNQPAGLASQRGGVLQIARSGVPNKFQLAVDNVGNVFARGYTDPSWSTWRKMFHDGNFTDNSANWNAAYGWGDYRQFGLGITTTTGIDVTDLNTTALPNGLYSFTSTAANNPAASSGTLIVERSGASNYITQKAHLINAGDVVRMFIRHYKPVALQWSPWREFYTNENLNKSDVSFAANNLTLSGTLQTAYGLSGRTNGHWRDLVWGFSGGNYGGIGYGINFTTTQDQHTLAVNDNAALLELGPDGGIRVRGYKSTGLPIGSVVPWSTIMELYDSRFTYKGNTVWHSGNFTGTQNGHNHDGYHVRIATADTISASHTWTGNQLYTASGSSYRAFSIRNTTAGGWSWFAMGGTSDAGGDVWHIATITASSDIGATGAFHIRGNNGNTTSLAINQDHSVRFRSSNIFVGATTSSNGNQIWHNGNLNLTTVPFTASTITASNGVMSNVTGATSTSPPSAYPFGMSQLYNSGWTNAGGNWSQVITFRTNTGNIHSRGLQLASPDNATDLYIRTMTNDDTFRSWEKIWHSGNFTDNSTNWNTAYNKKVNSLAFSGTTTKTLTLTLQDGTTLSANFTDIDTNTTYSIASNTEYDSLTDTNGRLISGASLNAWAARKGFMSFPLAATGTAIAFTANLNYTLNSGVTSITMNVTGGIKGAVATVEYVSITAEPTFPTGCTVISRNYATWTSAKQTRALLQFRSASEIWVTLVQV
jgi:hypothetical protein